MGRHGSRMVQGSYVAELSLSSFDVLFEAIMRSTWVPAVVLTTTGAGAFVDVTANANNQLTRTGTGSWITDGVRVGDVIRLTNYSTAGDNNLNLRVKAVTQFVITVQGTPLTVGAADTTTTVTILKKLKRPASPVTPVKRSFYIEEYYQDLDLSAVFGGCKFIGMKITGSPDGMATVEFSVLGASATPLNSAASPFYTSPTLQTSTPLVFADCVLNFGGVDVINATAFELNLAITAKTEPVIGSPVSPDVFDNDVELTGSLSFIRQDLSNLTAYTAETEFEMQLLLLENEAAPQDVISIYVPRVKLTDLTKSLGGDGALIETIPFTTGIKEGFGATGYDDTMLTICTSAP